MSTVANPPVSGGGSPNLEHGTAGVPAVQSGYRPVYGVIGEFDTPEQLLEAIRKIRPARLGKMEAYTPFPIHGIDDALGEGRSILGRIVLPVGLMGTAAAFLLIWYTGVLDYPLVIAGKPLFAWEFAVPIMFELTVLLAAFAAVFGMIALNGLPRLYHPVFNYSRSRRLSDDKFGLVIERGPGFDVTRAEEALRSAGATHTEVLPE